MKPVILCSLALAILGGTTAGHATPQPPAATAEIGAQEVPGPAPPQEQEQETLRELDPESALTNWRRIGIRSPGTDRCPEVGGWRSEDWLTSVLSRTGKSCLQLYGTASPELDLATMTADLVELHRLGLDRLCVYTALPGTPLDPFPKPAGLLRVASDRMAISGSGVPEDQENQEVLTEQFYDQIGKTPLELQGKSRVRLVFLDTQPDGKLTMQPGGKAQPLAPLGSKHGLALGTIAHQIVCPAGEPCDVSIHFVRTLHYSKFDPNQEFARLPDDESGSMGLVSDVAGAILQAVLDWQQSGPGKEDRLVLNASIGWEAVRNLDLRRRSRLDPATLAVLDAIRFARRQGALVVAAAGNRQGGFGKSSQLPLLPAAWELHHLSFLQFSFGGKRVYAVGGIDAQGLPLSNHRPGGLPRRVAYGDHAVAATRMYTGSSVSAAVTSSIAAVVWARRPELRPDQLMRLLDRSADGQPGRADFYAWKPLLPHPRLRELSLCKAIQRACRPHGKRCGDPPSETSCAARQPGPVHIEVPSDAAAVPCPELHLEAPPPICPNPDPASQLLLVAGETPSIAACTLDALPEVRSEPWVTQVLPQPGENPCGSICSINPPLAAPAEPGSDSEVHILVLRIDDEWKGLIQSAALEIECYDDGESVRKTTVLIPKNVLDQAQRREAGSLRVDGLVPAGGLKNCTAALNFIAVLQGGSERQSVQSPVYIDP
jgi:subtilase family protein